MLGALAGLTGCGKKTDPAPDSSHQEPSSRGKSEPVTCVYESEAGLKFVARFQDQEAWVFLPEGTLQLAQVPAASGARYSDRSVTLWTRGEEATLIRPGQADRGSAKQPAPRCVGTRQAQRGGLPGRGQRAGLGAGAVRRWKGPFLLGDYGQSRYDFEFPARKSIATTARPSMNARVGSTS